MLTAPQQGKTQLQVEEKHKSGKGRKKKGWKKKKDRKKKKKDEIVIKTEDDITSSHPLPGDLPAELVPLLRARDSEPSLTPGGQRESKSGGGSSPGTATGKAISEGGTDASSCKTEDLGKSSHPLPGDFPAELDWLFYASPFKYLFMHCLDILLWFEVLALSYNFYVSTAISKPKGRFEIFIAQLLIHSLDENLALTV